MVPRAGSGGAWHHAVQFYEGEDFLYDRVADFLSAGISAGEPAVVIATEAHREGFTTALRGRGVPLWNDRLTLIDAPSLLSVLMGGSMPDETAFAGYMTDVFAKSGTGERPARVYGELVDLLWRDGNPEAAIRLEEMWNALADNESFSLLCAYPISRFTEESDRARFASVCDAHTAVSPAESIALDMEDPRATQIATLQQQAATLQREVARRVELQKALETALAQQARARDQLFAIVSHELRTPLTAIYGWARMLRTGGLDAATTDVAIDTIARSASTLGTLVDDLLEASQQSTGAIRLLTEAVDLGAVVENAVETLGPAAEARSIRIDVDAARNLVVQGDARRLQQVVWNLVSNAVKFSNPGAVVSVRLERAGAEARIVVEDGGCGITPEFLSHVFEPFAQAAESTGRLHGGLGLGLAAVKYYVELHGGTVRVESEGRDRGARFVVTLPVAAQS